MKNTAPLLDLEPSTELFQQEVMAGLLRRPKELPSKYFYDERGSQLFDQICRLDEYYLTRTELAIMREGAAEMARQLGRRVALIELGSGSSVKTRLLLDHLVDPAAYVPVDISREHLDLTARRLAGSYPHVLVWPVCADFAEEFALPAFGRAATRRVVYLPGSTIGNFEHDRAQLLLARIAKLCGAGGSLLIGIDLDKGQATLERAYNDSRGVTAQFNLNLLRRINRELGANFDLENFEHDARYNRDFRRIEMFLVSRCDQLVGLGGEEIEFVAEESICTEYSHKYTVDGFAALAATAGFELKKSWHDDRRAFAVLLFVTDG